MHLKERFQALLLDIIAKELVSITQGEFYGGGVE